MTVRDLDHVAFDHAFASLAAERCWQEEPEYYPRYRTRYEAILRRFADNAPEEKLGVLDIGGGQLAYLAMALWQDDGSVADIDDRQFCRPALRGLDPFQWNVALDDPPTERRFDAIFFSEVIEHLPVPGHVALRRLRMLLNPGGLLLCSTPNLYRLRNIVYMLKGRQLFDHFDLPGERGYSHVLEYSASTWRGSSSGPAPSTAPSSCTSSRMRRIGD